MTAPDAEKKRLKDAGKKYAEDKVNELFANSVIKDKSGDFPKFEKKELIVGKVLGRGGFGTVCEVHGFDASKLSPKPPSLKKKIAASTRKLMTSTSDLVEDEVDDDEAQQAGQAEYRKFIADNCTRKNGDARYAIKFLSPGTAKDPGMFIQGSIDMAIETRLLSDTEHPNIIKMRALARMSPYNEEYFIVIDRLYDTLMHRMTTWRNLHNKLSGMSGKLFDRKGDKQKDLTEEILLAGYDLSDAFAYLHGRKIVYRDIKPENIGFDIRNDIKIFDFGLATELRDSRKAKDDLYNLTGMTGSPVYMAPEVANEMPYNEKCDVYSFAILFWEMYSLKKAFELYGMKTFKSRVWNGEHKRPFVQESWPVPIKTLLRRSWSKDISDRPAFTYVAKILRSECVRMRDGNEDGLEHQRRRSTMVFQGSGGL